METSQSVGGGKKGSTSYVKGMCNRLNNHEGDTHHVREREREREIERDSTSHMSRDVRKPVFGVFDQVRHKPAWGITEDG